ncbi:hypothetical protein GCM10010335_33320 [Streptomyces galbus]|nr:hypothetical protein GCM10010335_33320 [Streptomyces galbus]
MRPSRSKTMQREEVVPWSMAAMNGPAVWASVTVCSWEGSVVLRACTYGVRREFRAPHPDGRSALPKLGD